MAVEEVAGEEFALPSLKPEDLFFGNRIETDNHSSVISDAKVQRKTGKPKGLPGFSDGDAEKLFRLLVAEIDTVGHLGFIIKGGFHTNNSELVTHFDAGSL